jgi:HlyD family secretion protein
VLDRQIDPGQTVAASFQTPTPVHLAQDLTKMKLIVDVDDADIGNVRVGQDRELPCRRVPESIVFVEVSEVRSTPKTSNGVVDLSNVLAVDNSERLLQPGMTATAEITVTHVADTLLITECGAPVHAAGRSATARRWRWLPPAPTTARAAAPGSFARGRWPAARVAHIGDASSRFQSRSDPRRPR